ncbi:MAG: hypothetical protein R2874_10985 [Desulfobacterales bacterium]
MRSHSRRSSLRLQRMFTCGNRATIHAWLAAEATDAQFPYDDPPGNYCMADIRNYLIFDVKKCPTSACWIVENWRMGMCSRLI